jgi:L-asparaginase
MQVAQILMQYDDRILGGSGATHFARKNGFEPFSRFRSVEPNMRQN